MRGCSAIRLLPYGVLVAIASSACSRTAIDDVQAVGCEDCVTLTQARLFDGEACVSGAVVLRGNRIERVVSGEAFVASGQEVRLDGRTILPALFEMHAHVTSPSGPDPGMAGDELTDANFRAMLRSGVLTVLDLGAPAHVIFEVRDRLRKARVAGPRLLAAGPLLTPTGGHPCYDGTLPGDTCVFVDDAPGATTAVAALEASEPDVVKVVIESGREGFVLPRIDAGALRAVVQAASANSRLVVAHISHAEDIDLALDAGVRVFAHVPTYDDMTAAQAQRLAAQGAVVIPTLAVRDGYVRLSTGTMTELDDPALADDVPATEIAALKDPSRLGKVGQPENRPRYQAEFEHMRVNLRRCLEAGVTIAAGTDAGNLGVFHGVALRRELELYVQEGMRPGDAIRSATAVPADLLGLPARGRVVAGAEAELLVVRGNPCERIADLAEVDSVYRNGQPLDREALSLRHAGSLITAPTVGLPSGHACLRAGECADGLACDPAFFCSALCADATTCVWGAVCDAAGFPEAASTCQSGDGCSLLGQDCPNGTACVWSGHGSARCTYPGEGAHGEPCASWGGCAPGTLCDSAGTCRSLCAPDGNGPVCSPGQACVDDSVAAGLPIGHCE